MDYGYVFMRCMYNSYLCELCDLWTMDMWYCINVVTGQCIFDIWYCILISVFALSYVVLHVSV